MAGIPIKCHLCNKELVQVGGALWQLGDRKLVTLSCIDKACSTIKIGYRCTISVVLPEWEVIDYQLVFRNKDKWYRILSQKRVASTCLMEIDPSYMESEGHERILIDVSRFYDITSQTDLIKHSKEMFEKLKTLVVFL